MSVIAFGRRIQEVMRAAWVFVLLGIVSGCELDVGGWGDSFDELGVEQSSLLVRGTPGSSISGRFYRLDAIAVAGQDGLVAVSRYPSVNEQGLVAFTANLPTGNGVYVGDGGAPKLLSYSQVSSSRVFGEAVQLANGGVVVSQDRLAGSPPTTTIRTWRVASPGSPTDVAKSGGTGTAAFDSVAAYPSVNDLGNAAFQALRGSATLLATGSAKPYNEASFTSPIRPMVADDGSVVLRADTSTGSAIKLFNYALSSAETIANSTMFSVLGRAPGISDDGRVVAFYGDLTASWASAFMLAPGPGIFISVYMGANMPRRLVKVAGIQVEDISIKNQNYDGVCDVGLGERCFDGELGFLPSGVPIKFASFDPDARVSVVHEDAGGAGPTGDVVTVAFIGTPSAADVYGVFTAQKGLWSQRIDLRVSSSGDVDVKPWIANPVMQVGESLGGDIITDVFSNDALSLVAPGFGRVPGAHYVAFTAATSGGNMILRGLQTDADGDGAFDHWEADGIDFNHDGVIDLPANGSAPGFTPHLFRQDVFVEVDYMAGRRPAARALENVRAAFRQQNIEFNYVIDEEVATVTPLAPYRGVAWPKVPSGFFDDVRLGVPTRPCGGVGAGVESGHFGTPTEREKATCASVIGARSLVFRYVLFGEDLPLEGAVNGIASTGGPFAIIATRGLEMGPDFQKAIGTGDVCGSTETQSDCAKVEIQAGVFMHEFGHTLGLRHGGDDDVKCKPNYLSVMNSALTLKLIDGVRPLDYSAKKLADLNENKLVETAGIGNVPGRNVVFSGPPPWDNAWPLSADGAINWDFDEFPSESAEYAQDLNAHCDKTGLKTTLTGHDDWNALQFAVRRVGAKSHGYTLVAGVPSSTDGMYEISEISVEEVNEMWRAADSDRDGLTNNVDNCPHHANPDQTDSNGNGVGDPCERGSGAPDLQLVLSGRPNPGLINQNVTVKAVLKNVGTARAPQPGIAFSTLPQGLRITSIVVTGGGQCRESLGSVACRFEGGLAAGAVSERVTLTVQSGVPGQFGLSAEALDILPDPTPADNTASFALVIQSP